jgi:2-haloacid dehalogenase
MPAPDRPSTVVFDLGGVLIDWDPRYLYRQLLPDDEIEPFLDEIGFREWNHAQDAGGSWDDAVDALAARHPHRRDLIAAYRDRFAETMAGPIDGTVALLEELHDRGTRLIALTNWSSETFPHAQRAFGFLELFEGIVVSGEERVVKPDEAIFRALIDRYDVDPHRGVFVDDLPDNVAAARTLGFTGLLFRRPDELRRDLADLGLVSRKPATGAGSG